MVKEKWWSRSGTSRVRLKTTSGQELSCVAGKNIFFLSLSLFSSLWDIVDWNERYLLLLILFLFALTRLSDWVEGEVGISPKYTPGPQCLIHLYSEGWQGTERAQAQEIDFFVSVTWAQSSSAGSLGYSLFRLLKYFFTFQFLLLLG